MSSKPKDLQAIRNYLINLTDTAPVSISPTTIAVKLGIEEKQSTALLEHLKIHEEMLTSRAFVRCVNCNETYTLEGKSLDEYKKRATELAGNACKYCDFDLDDKEYIKIRLSYFYLGGMEHDKPETILPQNNSRYGSPLTIRDLNEIERRVQSLEEDAKKQLPRWMRITAWIIGTVIIPLGGIAVSVKSCDSSPRKNDTTLPAETSPIEP
ncbi:MAG: hypothetical protein ACSHX5_00180 [Phycisphaerales bacterium]